MNRYINIKYDRLDNESDDGSDVPLLMLDNQHNQINQNNQDNISSDSDSIILNLNQQQTQQTQQPILNK